MYPLTVRSLLWAMLIAISLPTFVFAQPVPGAEAEVATVRFKSIRSPNSSAAWLESDVELTIRPAVEAVRFVNKVKVVMNIGVEAGVGAKKQTVFYKASAEAITLEAGRSNFRFYLPPEVVRRDALQGDPKYFAVEISVDGKKLPTAKANFSFSTLNSPQVLESFLSKVASEGTANDGVFLPQFLTPFAYDTTRPAPSFVRLEVVR